MKTVFKMIGGGDDNIKAFDFDMCTIKKDAVCTFRQGTGEYTIKVVWRDDDRIFVAYATRDRGFVRTSDGRAWFTPDPEFMDALFTVVLKNRENDAGKTVRDEKGHGDGTPGGEIAWD